MCSESIRSVASARTMGGNFNQKLPVPALASLHSRPLRVLGAQRRYKTERYNIMAVPTESSDFVGWQSYSNVVAVKSINKS